MHWASWRRGKQPFLLAVPPFPGVSISQRDQRENNHMWEPVCRFFGMHAVGRRFIRSFEERVLGMVEERILIQLPVWAAE